MSARSLILAVALLALILWLAKLATDGSLNTNDVSLSDGSGDPTGLGSLVQSVSDAVSGDTSSGDDSMGKTGATLKDFAQAIYDFEDPNKNGVATRNNNPGNLKFAGQRGATGADSRGFAIFPDFQSGFDALVRQLKLNVSRTPDQTLLQDRVRYLGGDPSKPAVTTVEGNPVAYAQFIAGRLGASVDTTLGQLFGGKA